MIWKKGSYVMFTENVLSSGMIVIPAWTKCEVLHCTESHIKVKLPEGYSGWVSESDSLLVRNGNTKRKILEYKDSKLARILFSNEQKSNIRPHRKKNK